MRMVSFYHKDTGLFDGRHLMVSDDLAVDLNTPADHIAIDGHHDALSRRVDVSKDPPEVVDYQPAAPSSAHEWDAVTKRWELSASEQQAQQERRLAMNRIRYLEQHVQPRALREAALMQDGAQARLRAIDDEIAALRSKLTPRTGSVSETGAAVGAMATPHA